MSNENRKHPEPLYLLILGLIPVIAYFSLLALYSENIPNADDFDLFLDPALLDFSRLHQFLLQRHNEHFTLSARCIAWVINSLYGELNFQYLLLISHILLAAGIYLLLSRKQLSGRTLCILLLIFFSNQFSEASVWASASLSILPTIFFAILAAELTFSTGNDTHPWLWQLFALCAALLAAFSFAAGAACLPAICCMHARRRNALALLWLLLSVLVILLLADKSQAANSLALSSLKTLYAWCATLGAGLSFGAPKAAIVFGAFVLLLAPVVFTRTGKEQAVLSSVLLFAVASCLLLALGRSEQSIAHLVSISRYRIFSLLSYLCLIALYSKVPNIQKLRGLHFAIVPLLAAVLFCSFSWQQNFPQLSFRSKLLRDSAVHYTLSGKGLLHPNPAHAAQRLSQASRLGMYTLPLDPSWMQPSRSLTFDTLTLSKHPAHASLEVVSKGEHKMALSGWALRLGQDARNSIITLGFLSEQQNYYFSTQPRIRLDVDTHFRTKGETHDYTQSGFFALIDCTQMRVQKYSLRAFIKNGDEVVSKHLSRVPLLDCSGG